MFTLVTSWGINNWKLKLRLSMFGSVESPLSFAKTVRGLEYHTRISHKKRVLFEIAP